MMKARELQEKTMEELKALLLQTRQELYALRSELSVNKKLEKPHFIKDKRRDCARILTVLTQKQGAAS